MDLEVLREKDRRDEVGANREWVEAMFGAGLAHGRPLDLLAEEGLYLSIYACSRQPVVWVSLESPTGRDVGEADYDGIVRAAFTAEELRSWAAGRPDVLAWLDRELPLAESFAGRNRRSLAQVIDPASFHANRAGDDF